MFAADDHQRQVTVKLLRTDMASDPRFVERFERVMQASSVLSHPTLQAVFGWGLVELDGTPRPYVVSERLVGGSLRDLFDRGRRLTPSQALGLGLDVCRGLDHAHRRELFHGEISPSKLIFGADRRVRIIDLGISQLLVEQWWSDASSLPTHMARYASPEQARGDEAGPPSDVYSLCLCLIEGVTGDLPFVGDSTQSTLQARLGRLMPVSADLGPLAAVLERAGRPEPAERYSAAQFGRALMEQASKLPRPEPLPLVATGLFDAPAVPAVSPPPIPPSSPPPIPPPIATPLPEDAAVVSAEPVPTWRNSGGIDPALSAPEPASIDPALRPGGAHTDPGLRTPAPDAGFEVMDGGRDDAAIDPVALAGGAAMVSTTSIAPADDRPQLPRWLTRVLLPLVLMAALVGLGLLAVRLFSTPSYEVPDLVGLTTAEALTQIDDLGWSVELSLERSDLEPRPDHVIRTVPVAGQRLSRGEPFLIVTSEGAEFRRLPVLTGLTESEAVGLLESLALVPVVQESHDEDTPLGEVIRWTVPSAPESGAGSEVLPGTEVVLIVSLGPAPRLVPDLFAAPEAAAIEQLQALSLEVAFVDPVFSEDAPAGTIAAQSPEPGSEVERGSVVQLAVSKGPDLVIFPDLSGTGFEEAQTILAELDLEAVLEFGSSDGAFLSAAVDGASVSAGEPVRRFSRVTMVFL